MAKAIKEKPYRIRAVSENGAMAASIIQSAEQVPSLLPYYAFIVSYPKEKIKNYPKKPKKTIAFFKKLCYNSIVVLIEQM